PESVIEVQIPFVPKYLPRSNPPCQVIADFHDPSLILDDPRSLRFIRYRFTRENGTIGFVVGNMSKDTIAQDEDQEVDLTDILRYVTPQELQRYEHEDWKQEADRETNRRKVGRPRKQTRSPNKSSVEVEQPLDIQVGKEIRRERSRKRSLDQTGFLVTNAQPPISQPLPRRPGRPVRTKNAPSTLSGDIILPSDASHRQSFRSRALPLSTETPPRASYSMVQTALSETESEAQGAIDSGNRSERAISSRDQSEEELALIPSSNQRSLLIKDEKSKSSTSNSETEQDDVKTAQFWKESIDSPMPDHRSPDPDEDLPNSGRDLLGQFQATNVRRLPRHDDSSVVLKQFQVTQVRRLVKRTQSKSSDSDKLPSWRSSPASWSASKFLPNSIRNSLKTKSSPPQPQLKSPAKGSFGGSSAPAPASASSLFSSRPTQTLEPRKQESSHSRHRNLSPSKPNTTALPKTPLGQRELRKSITPHFPSAGILNKDGNIEPSYSSPLKLRSSHQIISNAARDQLRQRRPPVTDELALKHNIPDQADNRHASRAPPASASRAHSRRSHNAVKEDQQAAVREQRRSPHAAASEISSKSAFGSASGSSKASSKRLLHKDRRLALLEERRRDSRPASKPNSMSGPLSSSSAASRESLKDQRLRLGECILTSDSSDGEG
ncbi:MAG: hypothetical protein Q9214_001997, partial [Letrouitia sp. 1 TL-2023]